MPGDNPQDSVGSNQYAPSYATGSGVQYTGFGADNVVEKDVPNNGADEMRKYIQMVSSISSTWKCVWKKKWREKDILYAAVKVDSW